MVTENNELKTSAKHISYKCKYEFDGRKYNSDQWLNKNKCQCECKKRHICEKGYIWNPAICSCENGKILRVLLTIQ